MIGPPIFIKQFTMSTPNIVTPKIPGKRKSTKESGGSIRHSSSSSTSPCPSPTPRNNFPDYKSHTKRMKYLKDLNDYEPTGQKMQGSFGTINIVIEKSTNKKYVAKTCKSEPRLEHLFLREISLLIHVQNPLIVQFIGFAFDDFDGNTNNITIIMEYVENGSLADLIQMNHKCPSDYDNTKRQKILVGIARGLYLLHKRNIIHRDMKPENILIGDDYNIKITDFGQSKNFKQLNDSITSFGTSAYLAPESIEENSYSQKTDVYAFGILMYEVLSGTRAYKNIVKAKKWNAHKLQMKILRNDLRPEINFPINSGLKNLMEACWSKDPKKRPTFLEIFNKLSMSVNEHIIDLDDDKYESILNDSEDEDDDDDENELPFMKYCLNDVDHKELFLYVEELLDIDNSNAEISEIKNKIDELSIKVTELNKVAGLNKVAELNKAAGLNKSPKKTAETSQKVTIQNPNEQKKLREKCDELKQLLIGGNIVDVKLPDKLLLIHPKQFMNCSSLASIEIPPSVVTISNDAFSGCYNLKKVVIPPAVKRIEFNAFKNCSNIESIEIQSELESIGIGAFFGCSKLTKINIPSTIKIIEEATFYGCSSLENLTIPPSVESINGRAFYSTKIKEITIPAKVTNIKEGTFYNCGSLTKLNLPQSLTNIGDNAFYGCAALKKIDIPKTVESIGKDVFNNCTSLETIVIPESVKEIGTQMFMNCSSLKTANIQSNINKITSSLFSNCKQLDNVSLPSTYESIDDGAFNECSSLISIKFASALKRIGNNAFYNCTSLKSIELPKSLESIGDTAFKGCKSLKNFNVPEKLQSIGNYAFQECESLTKIEFKNKIDINTQAFYNCKKLREVSIYLDKLQNSVFYYCNQNLCVKLFTDKTILETADIGKLHGCFSNISYLIIPDTVQQINFPHSNQYQYHVNYLKGIEIPPSIQNLDFLCYFKSLTEITYDPYSSTINCDSKNNSNFYNVRHIIIKTNHKILDENLSKNIINKSVSKITISSEIKSIKKDAFAGLYSLNEVVIPPKVKLIETGAFPTDKSHLNTITIDPYRTTIQPYAFPKISGYKFTINIQNEKIDRNIMQNLLYISDHLTISGNVKIVEPQTFASSSLRRIAFNSKITHIGDYAFTECTSLTNAIFPKSLLHVGKYAFRGCSQLTFISCPNRPSHSYYGYSNYNFLPYAQFIGEYAFDGCTGLQKILINKNAKVEENGKGNYIYQRIDIKDLHIDEEKVKIKAEEEEEEREELFSELYGCE